MKFPITIILATIAIVGCTSLALRSLDERFGAPEVQPQRITEQATEQSEFYLSEVKPILEQRCVVCHGCYDAPCQLKFSSPAGIDRGMHHDKVYNATRITAAEPTRLYIDEKTTQAWRERGFRAVLNERQQSADANLEASVMFQALNLKQAEQQPLPTILDADAYDFSLDAKHTCPSIEDYANYAEDKPQNGMPYAMPQLSSEEFTTLSTWLADGASMKDDIARHQAFNAVVAEWEAMLNADDLKSQLMARYIYEHVYLFHLYFEENPSLQPAYFRLVRSSTPPGEPADEIASRRPYDDPQVTRVYYRIIPELESISSKTHIPYLMNDARQQRWQRWFLDADYAVTELPNYQPQVAGNPFVAYEAIPVHSRYRFMLDDAESYIMGFMKGPVCRGQVALNVIRDHFWVFFVDPDVGDESRRAKFLSDNSEHLRLPSVEQSNVLPISTWRKYSKLHHEYARSVVKALNTELENGEKLDMSVIWDGDGNNQNAALTITRHFDSASVVKGMVGQEPKTAWVIDYSLLERIHYLLVAGFDPYGNLGHQLVTRLYMDFLRFEGEFSFVAFLPEDMRYQEIASWYQGADKEILEYVQKRPKDAYFPSSIVYNDEQAPKQQFYQLLRERLGAAASQRYQWNEQHPRALRAWAEELAQWRGGQIKWLPQVSFVQYLDEQGQAQYFTLIKHNEHSNITSLFSEDSNRLPRQDYLSLVPGLVGAYPSSFLRVDQADLPLLVDAMRTLGSEQDYRQLKDRFAVRRTNPEFWQFSDRLHQDFAQQHPVDAALMDYNRIENR